MRTWVPVPVALTIKFTAPPIEPLKTELAELGLEKERELPAPEVTVPAPVKPARLLG